MAGLECDGYLVSRSAAPPAVVSILPAPLWRPAPAKVTPTMTEFELSRYFRQNLVVSAHDEFTLDRWRSFVPQAADRYAPMWHATNTAAAIALYRRYSASPSTEAAALAAYHESLRQFSLAVRQILDMLKDPSGLSVEDKTAILLANCLLGHCNLSFGDYIGVVAFWAYSNRLLKEWKYCHNVNSGLAGEHASYAIIQNLKAESIFREYRVGINVEVVPGWGEELAFLAGRPFVSITDVYAELEMLWATARAIVGMLPLHPTAEQLRIAHTKRAELRSIFRFWKERYAAFEVASPVVFKTLDECIHGALTMRRTLVGVLLEVDLGSPGDCLDDTCWDVFDTEFAEAVAVAQRAQVLPPPREPAAGSKTPSENPFATLLWKCLHFITSVCRNSRIRHNALETLQSWLYSNWVQGHTPRSIMGELIALEEGAWRTCTVRPGCVKGEFICNEHRIVRIDARQAAPKLTERTLRTVGDLLHGRPGYKFSVPSSTWC